MWMASLTINSIFLPLSVSAFMDTISPAAEDLHNHMHSQRVNQLAECHHCPHVSLEQKTKVNSKNVNKPRWGGIMPNHTSWGHSGTEPPLDHGCTHPPLHYWGTAQLKGLKFLYSQQPADQVHQALGLHCLIQLQL